MTRLTLDISTSLDGFVAGPNQTLEQPLGEGGERLHEWALGLASFRERHGRSGGGQRRRRGDGGIAPRDRGGRDGQTDGIEAALEQARAAAGDKDVALAGGASVAQQYLKAGLLDELQIHLVPLLLGGGVHLFDRLGVDPIQLESIRVIESPAVTHLKFRVVQPAGSEAGAE
jgi:hypothetical protein